MRKSLDNFVRAEYGEILFELAVEKGASPLALIRSCGIREGVLRDPSAMLSRPQFESLVREAIRMSGDPALGMAFGHRLKFTTHGAVSQLAVSSDTLQQSLEALIKYYRLRFEWIEMRFFTEDDEAVIELRPTIALGDLEPFLIEAWFASIMDVNELLFGSRLLPGGSCRIGYPAPPWAESYKSVFHQEIAFGAGQHQLRFRKAFLALPMALANPVTRRLAEQACQSELAALVQQESASDQVRRLLLRSESRLPDMEEMAERLHTTSRTLRRQLQVENTRFQDLLTEVRRQRAEYLLLHTSQPVDDIALLLGYSDPSNFGRAFRRWTGVSPGGFREQGGPVLHTSV